MTTLQRRLDRLDRGISSEARALDSMTDAELDARIKAHLVIIDPAAADRYGSFNAYTVAELRALLPGVTP
jgi:hypothetical protein